MYKDFDKMPVNSRIWVYQADRMLTAKEENIAAYFLKESIENWAAHGTPLLASAEVLESRFIVIALDEDINLASGCSIDASTHWLKELGAKLNVDFFDRSIAYLVDNQIHSFPVFKAKLAVLENTIEANTILFNNNISKLHELKTNWKVPAIQLPFIGRFFKKEVA